MKPIYDVFLSYSHRDRTWSHQLRENLVRSDVEVFVDTQEIDRTEEIQESIRAGLRGSRYLLLVLSPDSIASPWVRKELSDRSRDLLVCRYAAAPLPEAVLTNEETLFDFEPSGSEVHDYPAQYRREFGRLCRRLGKEATGDLLIEAPTRNVPREIYDEVIDLLAYVLRWPATRKGLSLMLGLEAETLETEQQLRMAANLLVAKVATSRGLPNLRACREVMLQLQRGCQLDSEREQRLASLLAQIEGLIAQKVDDEFVQSVTAALGDDRYGIKRILGGSFTIVLQVVDHALEREQIVKVLRPSVGSTERLEDGETRPQIQEVRKAFRYYTRVAATVEHPVFSRVYGAHFSRNVDFWISDYSPGVSMASLARLDVEIELPILLSFLAKITRGLVYLEHHDLVHTHLNSENIFVSATGDIRVSPSGVARLKDDFLPMPRLYELAGNRSKRAEIYFGPELRATGHADHAIHQYGLGMLVIELLASDVLENLGFTSTGRCLRDQLVELVEGASKTSATERLATVRPVLERMLDPAPGNRYPSLRTAVQQLRRLLVAAHGGPVRVKSTSARFRRSIQDADDTATERQQATVRARESLNSILTDQFLQAFHQRFQDHPRVAEIFGRRWRGQDRETAESQYFDKLRRALQVVIDYGAFPAYESLELEKVVATHDGYGVDSDLYGVFAETLMETLEAWDPPFGVTEGVDDVRAAWGLLVRRVLRYVQSRADPVSA